MEDRSVWDSRLAESWEQLRAQMWDLFEHNQIPIAKQYYEESEGELPITELKEPLDYNNMLTEILLQSTYINPELQTMARGLVREFKQSVKKVLEERKVKKEKDEKSVKYISY